MDNSEKVIEVTEPNKMEMVLIEILVTVGGHPYIRTTIPYNAKYAADRQEDLESLLAAVDTIWSRQFVRGHKRYKEKT